MPCEYFPNYAVLAAARAIIEGFLHNIMSQLRQVCSSLSKAVDFMELAFGFETSV